MTPAERAALMGLAEEWDEPWDDITQAGDLVRSQCADELRARVAELEREDGDG